MNRKTVGISVVAVMIAVVAALVLMKGEPAKQPASAEKVAEKKAVGLASTVKAPAKRNTVGKSVAPKPILDLEEDDDDDKRTPEEKALAEKIEKSLDDENLADALACAPEAMKCGNEEIRQAMVDTLGWFGAKALPELTPFLADPSEDVRDSAMNEWSMAVSDIEDDAEKIGTVELAMSVLSDEDALENISGEYIGVDEKLAVESLMRVIAAGATDKGVEKAKETYEFVTGDEWKGEEAANRWIAEEYQPPEE